jgi:GMP synthase-like glutamine amidotransferase
MTVGRYHSLVVEEDLLPACFEATARSADAIMAIAHRELPVVGVQFHPESILTDAGYSLLVNFLKLANIDVPPVSGFSTELNVEPKPSALIPTQPVTF